MRVRVAYLVYWSASASDGVTRKLLAQIARWEDFGVTARLFCVSRRIWAGAPPQMTQVPSRGVLRERFVVRRRLVRLIRAWSPDVIYLRGGLWVTSLRAILRRGQPIPIVREINTDERAETWKGFVLRPSPKNVLRFLESAVLTLWTLPHAHGIVSVTREIDRRLPRSARRVARLVLPNAINLSETTPLRPESQPVDHLRTPVGQTGVRRPALFFIGSPEAQWHGVDIIERLASETPEFDYHIVGPAGSSHANVHYHGVLPQAAYRAILADCDVCIGTLALYRKNMTEACPLKVREYLALGFPTIVGYEDTAFPVDSDARPWWFLRVDGRRLLGGDEVEVERVRSFVQTVRGRTIPRDELASIDDHTIERNRVAFFRQVLAAKTAGGKAGAGGSSS